MVWRMNWAGCSRPHRRLHLRAIRRRPCRFLRHLLRLRGRRRHRRRARRRRARRRRRGPRHRRRRRIPRHRHSRTPYLWFSSGGPCRSTCCLILLCSSACSLSLCASSYAQALRGAIARENARAATDLQSVLPPQRQQWSQRQQPSRIGKESGLSEARERSRLSRGSMVQTLAYFGEVSRRRRTPPSHPRLWERASWNDSGPWRPHRAARAVRQGQAVPSASMWADRR